VQQWLLIKTGSQSYHLIQSNWWIRSFTVKLRHVARFNGSAHHQRRAAGARWCAEYSVHHRLGYDDVSACTGASWIADCDVSSRRSVRSDVEFGRLADWLAGTGHTSTPLTQTTVRSIYVTRPEINAYVRASAYTMCCGHTRWYFSKQSMLCFGLAFCNCGNLLGNCFFRFSVFAVFGLSISLSFSGYILRCVSKVLLLIIIIN